MKTALYITSTSETQIVLTPETDLEKTIMAKMFPEPNPLTNFMSDGMIDMKVFKGSFYECKGGWNRQGSSDDSIIIRLHGGA